MARRSKSNIPGILPGPLVCPAPRWVITLACFVSAVFSPLAAAQTVYIAFGDSITDGDDSGGYPSRLEALLDDTVVRNRGLGGEKTPEGLTRIDTVLSEGGDALLLMEGTNDISRTISMETTLFNLNEMARKAEDLSIRTFHATVIPRLPNAKVDRDNVLNQQLNQEIRASAGENGRDLIDNFEVFSQQQGLFSRLYTEDPLDPVGHPNGEGYDVMARVFADVLEGRDTVPPVPGILRPNHGDVDVADDTSIEVEVWDFGVGLDLGSVVLEVNGARVDSTVSETSPNLARLTHTPEAPLSGAVSISLLANDMTLPSNRSDRQIALFFIAGSAPIDGDLDHDGHVDGNDLIRLALSFGSGPSSRRWDARADLNGDRIIDGSDLAILAANFGRSL